jgi:BirA family biotin operon repressor/biotin-[acetyl-CoA-carboxylase] ligase
MSISINQNSLFKEMSEQAQLGMSLQNIHVFECVDSTQAYLKNEIKNFPSLVVSDAQNEGKGRFSRNWYSSGENVLMSCSWKYDSFPKQLSGLSLALIVELAELLRDEYLIPATIKWPNDLLLDGKKGAGMLVDVESGASCSLYIGLGLNVEQSSSKEIDQPWLDMASCGAKNVDRNRLIGRLFSRWFSLLSSFPQTGFSAYRQRWINLSEHNGKEVALYRGDEKIHQGIMSGVDGQGFLLIESKDGLVQITDSECSLRAV